MKSLSQNTGSLILSLLAGSYILAQEKPNSKISGWSYPIRWSRIADYPVRLSELSAIAMRDRIYVTGGHDEGFKQFNDTYVGIIEKVRLKPIPQVKE
jgi:hypothetical protein